MTTDAVHAGQAVYSRRTLAIYDWLVLGFSNRFVWRCPTRHLVEMYNENISENHLDVGVGTGFFLDRCDFPSASPRIVLLDLNSNCLHAAAQRIARYQPEIHQANVLEPIEMDGVNFDSVGINYLLHCLPGNIQTKTAVLANLKQHMNPNAVLFGSTILHDGVRRNWMARRLMKFYNDRRIFTNTYDNLDDLESVLHSQFDTVSVRTIGCVALFQVSQPMICP